MVGGEAYPVPARRFTASAELPGARPVATSMSQAPLTAPRLAKIVDRFHSAPKELRVQALLAFSKKVPALPEEYGQDRSRLERVHECQTPFFVATRLDTAGAVHLHFDAPEESPTIRGFAGILYDGLEGEPAEVVLSVPPDFYARMGLETVVSPQRLNGMSAILGRIQRQVREQAEKRATTT